MESDLSLYKLERREKTNTKKRFCDRKIAEIEAKDIIVWQDQLMIERSINKERYSATYLKTIHSQLSAIFNHAVRFYHLLYNPAQRAGTIGSEEHKGMLFWIKEKYIKFLDVIMDKPLSFYAFELLYWCGIRVGELLTLMPVDFDFEKGVLTINKSYQRLQGEDVITKPKTTKNNQTIQMPNFLCEEMKDYLKLLYGCKSIDRIFPITKSKIH